jgi:long-subunit fatty acid transport protein
MKICYIYTLLIAPSECVQMAKYSSVVSITKNNFARSSSHSLTHSLMDLSLPFILNLKKTHNVNENLRFTLLAKKKEFSLRST